MCRCSCCGSCWLLEQFCVHHIVSRMWPYSGSITAVSVVAYMTAESTGKFTPNSQHQLAVASMQLCQYVYNISCCKLQLLVLLLSSGSGVSNRHLPGGKSWLMMCTAATLLQLGCSSALAAMVNGDHGRLSRLCLVENLGL